jgi:hypothetical protein
VQRLSGAQKYCTSCSPDHYRVGKGQSPVICAKCGKTSERINNRQRYCLECSPYAKDRIINQKKPISINNNAPRVNWYLYGGMQSLNDEGSRMIIEKYSSDIAAMRSKVFFGYKPRDIYNEEQGRFNLYVGLLNKFRRSKTCCKCGHHLGVTYFGHRLLFQTPCRTKESTCYGCQEKEMKEKIQLKKKRQSLTVTNESQRFFTALTMAGAMKG